MLALIYFATVVGAQLVHQDLLSHPNWKLLDLGENCGLSSNYRIIGGHDASLGQYPWMARLDYTDLNNISADLNGCGGTLINDRYILTAAHCHPKSLPGVVRVRLGEYDLSKTVDCKDRVCAPPLKDIDVEEYRCYLAFNVTDPDRINDICLVRLAKLIQFNIFEKLQHKTFDNHIMEVAGWGIEDIEIQQTSDILQTLKVPIVPENRCKIAYQQYSKITNRQLCAGGVVGKDSCSGDSGGPLMAPLSVDGPPRYFLMGIVSYGP